MTEVYISKCYFCQLPSALAIETKCFDEFNEIRIVFYIILDNLRKLLKYVKYIILWSTW